jgi:hypothetical protein
MKVKDLQQKLDCIAEDADLISLFIEKDGVDLETNRLRFKFEMKCFAGDYIIKGVKGEFYPCKPDIFEMTYERVEE